MDEKTLDTMPFDIVMEIFQYLSFEDLVLSMQNVSSYWQNMVQDPSVWREISFKPPFGMTSENVVSLLELSPLLRSFEFRVGLKQSEIFDALCIHNPNIISLSFDAYDTNSGIIEKLIEKFPGLQFLQLPMAVFVNHIPVLCKMKNLKNLKCIQQFQENVPIAHKSELIDEETDWCSLKKLELSSDHPGNCFTQMMKHVRGQLISLEIQTVHFSRFLEHLKYCEKLETLKVNFTSRQMSDEDIDLFFVSLQNLLNLKCLCISSFVHSDANVLCKVFDKQIFPNLLELKLNHCFNFTPRVARSIAEACPKLEIIRLNGCLALDDSSLCELSRCIRLCNVDIPGCLNISELGLSYLTNCLKLSKLNISWIGLVSAPALEQIAKMKRLTVLNIDHTEVDSTHLIHTVNQLAHLVLLSVYCTTGVNGPEFQKSLPRCYVRHSKRNLIGIVKEKASTLRKLQINGVTQSVLNILSHSENIEDLSINFVHYPCHTFPEVFNDIKRFGKLKKLSLKAFATTDDDILGEMLSGEGLSQLRELNLENCLNVNEDVATVISNNNPQLEKLRLHGCLALTNEGLSAIVKLKNLSVLDISSCISITETGLLSLNECKSLTDLNINGILQVALSSDVLNSILSLPMLSYLHFEKNELIEQFLQNKNWIKVENLHMGRLITYVSSEQSSRNLVKMSVVG